MAEKHLLLVLAEPTEGQEAAFNDYHEDVHLDEVLATTGWRRAQRFKLVDQAGHECPLPYLVLYEMEAEESTEVLQTLQATRPERLQSDALNRRTAGAWVFKVIGPVHE